MERSETTSSLLDITMSTNSTVSDITNHYSASDLSSRLSSTITSPVRNAGGAMAFSAAPSSVMTERTSSEKRDERMSRRIARRGSFADSCLKLGLTR